MPLSANVDPDLCVGAAVCEAIAADTFELGDDGFARAIDPPGDDEDRLLEARDSCPSGAITVHRDGEPID